MPVQDWPEIFTTTLRRACRTVDTANKSRRAARLRFTSNECASCQPRHGLRVVRTRGIQSAEIQWLAAVSELCPGLLDYPTGRRERRSPGGRVEVPELSPRMADRTTTQIGV